MPITDYVMGRSCTHPQKFNICLTNVSRKKVVFTIGFYSISLTEEICGLPELMDPAILKTEMEVICQTSRFSGLACLCRLFLLNLLVELESEANHLYTVLSSR